MALTKEDIVKLLDDKKIKYEIVEHKPVYTIDEMLECDLPHPEQIAKNLFIRDDKKRKYYLITCLEDKKVNLKEFRKEHDTRPLTLLFRFDDISYTSDCFYHFDIKGLVYFRTQESDIYVNNVCLSDIIISADFLE